MLHTLRFSPQNVDYINMLNFLDPVLFTFYIHMYYNLNEISSAKRLNINDI
jgi:hypothetical protein